MLENTNMKKKDWQLEAMLENTNIIFNMKYSQ